jgi:hypothetical protein
VKLNNQERGNDIHCEMKCGIKWLISHNDAGWVLDEELDVSERCGNVHYVLKCVMKWLEWDNDVHYEPKYGVK